MKYTMSIKNYKSFKKNQNIEIGPITIFVGPNSAGKSSILKLLGFLHQNYHALIFEKIQYNGDMVNFKDFESLTNIFNRKDVEIFFNKDISWYEDYQNIWCTANNKPLKIKYQLTDSSLSTFLLLKVMKEYRRIDVLHLSNKEKLSVIQKVNAGKSNYIDSIKLLYSCETDRAESMYSEFVNDTLLNYSISFNGINLQRVTNQFEYEIENYGSIDIPIELKNKFMESECSGIKGNLFSKNDIKYLGKLLNYYDFTYLASEANFSPSSNDLENSTVNHNIFESDKNIFHNIQQVFQKNIDYFDVIYLKQFLWRHLSNELYEHSISIFNKLEKFINSKLIPTVDSILKNIVYIPPVRPNPKRYYTKNELIKVLCGNFVNKNNILNSSSNFDNHIKSINDLLNQLNFNFEILLKRVSSESLPDLYVIELRNKRSNHINNIVDVGHGFSQIIPILYNLVTPSDNLPITLILEQPELHLHPKLQSKLADIFIESGFLNLYNSSHSNSVLVETHSEYLIRKLLVYIARGKLNPDDLYINYVGSFKNGNSYVKRMAIDEQGFFKDKWPEGFFDNSLKLSEELWTARKNKE
jgi:predicted ATPase